MTDVRIIREEERIWQEPDGVPAVLREELRAWRELVPPLVAGVRMEVRAWSIIETAPTAITRRIYWTF